MEINKQYLLYLLFSNYLRTKQITMTVHFKVLKMSLYLMKQNISNNKSNQSKMNQIHFQNQIAHCGGQ